MDVFCSISVQCSSETGPDQRCLRSPKRSIMGTIGFSGNDNCVYWYVMDSVGEMLSGRSYGKKHVKDWF